MGLRFNIDIGIKSQGAGQAAGDIRKVKTEAAGAGKTIGTINASLVKMASLVGVAFSVREISQFVASTVKAASDVQEMQSLLEVTFGKAVDDVREWAAETSGAVGRSRFELLQFAGDFASFLKPLGTAPDQIRPISQELAQLTVDLASFRNLTEEDVFIKLQSGLAGEAEAMRRLGVDLSAAAVQQELFNQGIQKSQEEVTQAEKIMARYAIIMRQTADAQGDAERTSDGLANMQRRLKGILLDLRVEIGEQLLPIITEMAQDLAEFSQTQEFEDTLKDIGSAAGSAAELVKGLVDAVRGLTNLGEPLANVFNTISGQDVDPERLRKVASVIEGIERFLTADLGRFAGGSETALASRIRDLADSAEEAGQKVRNSKPDFDLSGVLTDADVKIAELTADQMKRIGVETMEAGQLSKKALAEAEAAAKKYQDRIEDLRREVDPIGTRVREIKQEQQFLNEAWRRGDIDVREYALGVQLYREELEDLNPQFEILQRHLENLPKGVPFKTEGIDEMADEISIIVARQEEAQRAQEEWRRVVVDQIEDWRELGHVIGDVLGRTDSDLGQTIHQVVDLIANVKRLAVEWETLSNAQRAAGVVGVASQAVDLAGLGGEGEVPGAFGGSGGGDYADVGAQAGAVIGAVIGAAIAAYFTGGLGASEGAVIGAAIGGLIGEVIGGFINRGADEGLGQLQLIAGEIETKVLKNEGGLGKAIQGIGDAVIENLNRITEVLQVSIDSLPTVDIKVRGENIVAKVGEYRKVFQEIDEAIEFLVTETLRAAEFSGGIDEAFTQILQAGRFGDLEGLSDQLALIDELVTAEKVFVQGLSEMEVQLEGLPRKLALMRTELENMGLSADQVIRLSGAAAVQAFAQARQAITGEQLSVAERQQIQQAQAELFNAQIELEIARLEAERQALLAEAGLTEAEIKLLTQALDAKAQGLQAEAAIAEREVQLHGNVIDGRSKFLQAEASVFAAEQELGQRFLQGMVEIIRVGGDTLGSILGSLPEEIRKQVEAITKIINALKNIGTIDLGRLRLPGVPQVPTAPRVPTGAGPGDVEDASRAAREAVDELIRSLDEMTAEMVANINELKSSIADLQRFREGLLVGNLSPLPLAGQLEEAERQLREAAARARAGDVDAFGEVQQLSQQFLQLLAGVFGTGGPGFQAGFRFVDELLGNLIEEGNRLVESETELLRAMRSNTADQLAAQREQLGLTREEIKEIRTGWESQVAVQKNIIAEQKRLRDEMRADNAALRRAIVELAETTRAA